MGMIERIFTLLFGGGTSLVKDTAEVFRENAEARGARQTSVQLQALEQHGAEFLGPRVGVFDRFMDALNRVPRPALALGTLGLFASAMVAPLWFAERMQGIALVPEPLWWLLGVVVSFYFGARHQVKAQQFQREIVATMGHVPEIVGNMTALRNMRLPTPETPGVADPRTDVALAETIVTPSDNPALEAWRKSRM